MEDVTLSWLGFGLGISSGIWIGCTTVGRSPHEVPVSCRKAHSAVSAVGGGRRLLPSTRGVWGDVFSCPATRPQVCSGSWCGECPDRVASLGRNRLKSCTLPSMIGNEPSRLGRQAACFPLVYPLLQPPFFGSPLPLSPPNPLLPRS